MFRPEKKFLSRDPPTVKGKIFNTRFGLIHVQTRKKIFCWGTPPPVKGKFFDTRFGLIHVQTGEKIFCWGTPPPPSKGKNFWHQIWLHTCSDWGKKFLLRDPPPQVKGKIFDTRFGLIHVQTGKKNFCWGTPPPRNIKKLLWLCGRQYASCIHTGELSCCSKILGPWWGPMKTFCLSVNVDGVGIVLAGGGDTWTLDVITELVWPFYTEPWWGVKTSLNCPHTLTPCKCSKIILGHKKKYSKNDLRQTNSVLRLFSSIKKYS